MSISFEVNELDSKGRLVIKYVKGQKLVEVDRLYFTDFVGDGILQGAMDLMKIAYEGFGPSANVALANNGLNQYMSIRLWEEMDDDENVKYEALVADWVAKKTVPPANLF